MSAQANSALIWSVVIFALLVLIIGGVLLASFFKKELKVKKELGPHARDAKAEHEREEPAIRGEVPPEELPPTQSPPPLGAIPTPQKAVPSEKRAPVPAAAPEDEFKSSRTVGEALQNTEKSFFGRLKGLFQNETATKNFEDIEEILYTSDLGPQTVVRLMEKLEDLSRSEKSNLAALKSTLKTEFMEIFDGAQIPEPNPQNTLGHLKNGHSPTVWMIVGVNGAGKTTTIGKLSAHLARDGKRVLVAAGDTFRAAAGSQLKAWTDRAQVEFFSPPGVTDPSAVAFEALTKAKSQGFDVVLVDTAGRLHTQVNLMEELKKVKRVMGKVIAEAPHETLIVLDANSGQNALQQAREFHQALALTGVILTKMDGTAKGGVAVGLAQELKIPIRLIGIGEKIGDLKAFSAREFVDSILGGA
jgi:fused signal recognition particle receptor